MPRDSVSRRIQNEAIRRSSKSTSTGKSAEPGARSRRPSSETEVEASSCSERAWSAASTSPSTSGCFSFTRDTLQTPSVPDSQQWGALCHDVVEVVGGWPGSPVEPLESVLAGGQSGAAYQDG